MTRVSACVPSAGGVLAHLRQSAGLQLLDNLSDRPAGTAVHPDPGGSQAPDRASSDAPDDHRIRIGAGKRSDRTALAVNVVLIAVIEGFDRHRVAVHKHERRRRPKVP